MDLQAPAPPKSPDWRARALGTCRQAPDYLFAPRQPAAAPLPPPASAEAARGA